MPLIKRKQIDATLDGYVRITSISASATSTNISTALSTALATAGRNGVSVPVQVSSGTEVMGVVTAKRVEIFDGTTKLKFSDGSVNGNDEVYGKIAESTGVYTLSYFTNEAGTETAYSFPTSTSIIAEFPYRYDFARLPPDFAVSIIQRNGSDDPKGGSSASLQTELLAVTGSNTIGSLTKTPNLTSNVFLIVNQALYDSLGGAGASFSVASKTISWSTVNAGFSIEVGDRVVASYTTLE